MNLITLQRYIGNFLIVVGYFVLLYFDLKLGLILKVIGGLFTIPFAVKFKLWDVLLLCGFFGVMEITKIIQLFFS
jgi:hypothetical protein